MKYYFVVAEHRGRGLFCYSASIDHSAANNEQPMFTPHLSTELGVSEYSHWQCSTDQWFQCDTISSAIESSGAPVSYRWCRSSTWVPLRPPEILSTSSIVVLGLDDGRSGVLRRRHAADSRSFVGWISLFDCTLRVADVGRTKSLDILQSVLDRDEEMVHSMLLARGQGWIQCRLFPSLFHSVCHVWSGHLSMYQRERRFKGTISIVQQSETIRTEQNQWFEHHPFSQSVRQRAHHFSE